MIPIEIWDLPVAGKLLQEWRDDVSFPDRLADVAIGASELRTWDAATRRALAGVRRVHLAGGGAMAEIEAAFAARGLACSRDDDPFTAARHGARLYGTCADVGQTAIKLVRGDRAIRIPRDWTRAPMRDAIAVDQRDAARASTIDFLAAQLTGATRALIALPCEIVDGVPRGCSYCWRDPDPALVGELARRSGASIEIVNDAVLAAHAAPPAALPTLVLTIGFGVGAAIVLP